MRAFNFNGNLPLVRSIISEINNSLKIFTTEEKSNFKKLQEEIKITTATVHSISIENQQQPQKKQGKQLVTNKHDNTITSVTCTSHQPGESKTQQTSQYREPNPALNPLGRNFSQRQLHQT